MDVEAAYSTRADPCFLQVGTLEVARTKERWEDHRRKLGVAQSWGVPGARIIGPEETRELIPLLDPGEILGSYHVPYDGIGKPLRGVAAAVFAGWAGVVAGWSAGRVTRPWRLKSRSCEGPIVSADGGGAAVTSIGASLFCAAAGMARASAKAAAAPLKILVALRPAAVILPRPAVAG